METSATSSELVAFIERIGEKLDWSSRYMDLAATTVGAVFRALDLDEASDRIPLGEAETARQVDALLADLYRRERSVSTMNTYKSTWRRIADLAGKWLAAIDLEREDEFWENVEQYRDTRPQRRSSRSQSSEQSTSTSHRGSSSAQRIEISVEGGVVTIEIPNRLSRAEAMTVVEALLAEAIDTRDSRG